VAHKTAGSVEAWPQSTDRPVTIGIGDSVHCDCLAENRKRPEPETGEAASVSQDLTGSFIAESVWRLSRIVYRRREKGGSMAIQRARER
jgi:hypothetical protein